MASLWIVSLIWAFSFGLIKYFLADLDFTFIAAARLGLATILFLPFLRLRGTAPGRVVLFLGVGAIQYGLMYILYTWSFARLQAYEVALFTIFTPIYVTLLEDLLARRFVGTHLLLALLAVAGTGVIEYRDLTTPDHRAGLLLVQGANLCFAFGQVAWRRLLAGRRGRADLAHFGLAILGGFLVTLPVALARTGGVLPDLDWRQLRVLLYLGLCSSGICFFLWNYGARQVGAGALAVCNNLKVPLAVLVSLLVFREETNLFRLILGGSILLALVALSSGRRGAPREADPGS